MGLLELLNVGVRIQLDQAQIGIVFGSLPIRDQSLFSVSGDVYYHFGGLSKLANSRLWYGRIGLNYLRDETRDFIDEYFYLDLRIGRDFNLSKKFGIELDIGAILQLYNDKMRKNPSNGWNFDFDFPLLPSFGIGLFYRL